MSRLEMLREEMLRSCATSRIANEYCVVDTVSFQPFRGKHNEDRVVSQTWDVHGHKWLFLTVFDGHGGSATSDYAARVFSGRLRPALCSRLDAGFTAGLEKGQLLNDCVANMLHVEIKAFDNDLGRSVKDLFPNLRAMTEEDIRRTINENEETILRAYFGSTIAGVLVNLPLKYMWSFGLGDSSIMITTTHHRDPVDSPRYKVLNTLHNLRTPKEYLTQKLKHPADEDFIDKGRFMLGGTELTRTLGDYHYKLPAKYVRHIFRLLPGASTSKHFDYSGKRIKTPPYITNQPEVASMDLSRFEHPQLVLFTDGVDNIVRSVHCLKGSFRRVSPGQIMAQLVFPHSAPFAGRELGHAVEPGPISPDDNRAVDILANLLGGTDTERLSKVLDQTVLHSMSGPDWDPNNHIYIDDTTIAVCEFTF